MRQAHGNAVRMLPDSAPDSDGPPADGAVLRTPGEALAIASADCVPILLHAPESGLAAAAHAGWRGTAAGVGERTVAALVGESGDAAASFLAAIGPAIGACCFEVGPEVPDAFRERGRRVPEAGRNPTSGRLHLDLIRANREQLLDAGLRARNIHAAARCTRCGPGGFHSYRRDGPGAGRNWAILARPLR